jgi:hypothetical protein
LIRLSQAETSTPIFHSTFNLTNNGRATWQIKGKRIRELNNRVVSRRPAVSKAAIASLAVDRVTDRKVVASGTTERAPVKGRKELVGL